MGFWDRFVRREGPLTGPEQRIEDIYEFAKHEGRRELTQAELDEVRRLLVEREQEQRRGLFG